MHEEFSVVLTEKDVDLRGSVLVTGFRGFGMVGYMVSKHLSLALGARKIGYIISSPLPPVLLIEEDGAGFPYELYFSEKARTVIVVNRAIPDREYLDSYASGLAGWAKSEGIDFAVLVGGLSRDFKPRDEKHGYRWIANRYYKRGKLDAPLMEPGLGVMGPLALLYMYMDYYRLPAIMILPYSMVEEVDYDAALVGVNVISEKILGIKTDTATLEEMAARQKEEMAKTLKLLIEQQRRESSEEERGMYM